MTQIIQKSRVQKAFSLVELMIVIVILGILISVGTVQLIHAKDRANNASIQANMHAFQTSIELYALDHGGHYPLSVTNLQNHSQLTHSPILQNMKNPITNQTGLAQAYQDESVGVFETGVVTLDTAKIFQYHIYGYDRYKNRIQNNKQDLILSNG